ncbi:DUF262 domain-containing protein [Nonomuraea glycinis]|uniref:DUF262 domain-containing protein n=1 Tax=Nonomuraea glycinis TaxID=2047744 RepID=A0A918ABE0_9ACTN|nr:DUF262 domain-containing protein [Nonomuraea glycinis]MCA2181016.1 DUF262 domain-containing protein [Nonomuraea glycinis]GGP13224.1 hypothetical protein GCM10012278_64150 [Nonomuraea glycinis]
MKAVQITLRSLFKAEQQMVVPLYQRPYSWGRDQLERLWSDISRQAAALKENGVAGHFLGSVVLAPSPDSVQWDVRWIVVDGQQRLTTLLLALCVIRDHLAMEDPGHRSRINGLCLINADKQEERRYRLLPTHADRQEFQLCVEGVGEDVDGKIGEAYRFFREKLIEVDDPADPDSIRRIETVILDCLDLVQIAAGRDDDVFQIFESINNTGMRLSEADLIRNYVFMCLPTRSEDVYEQHWLPAQRRLGIKGLEELMRLMLVLTYGEQAQRMDVYRGHQKLLHNARGDEENVEQYVVELARRAGHLERILKPDETTSIGVSIAFLGGFRTTSTYPVIMKLLEFLDDGHAADQEVVQALQYIESFLVRRFIGRVPASLTPVFQRLARLLTPNQPVTETVMAELSRPQLKWSSDKEFRRDVTEKNFYGWGSQSQQKFILRRLEESYPSKERADLSSTDITIEHVLPQNPTESWLNGLAGEGDDPRLMHRQLVHTLGNLTLTGYNPELGNTPFEQKRELFRGSGIAMNQKIAQHDKWGKEEILARAEELADRAIEIWPGPDESSRVEVPVPDWAPLTRILAAIPPATWVSYGDLAWLIGSHAVPVRVYLDKESVPGRHRVLTSDGEPPSDGRSVTRNELRQAMQSLVDDGIELDELGRARAEQRIIVRELAKELGLLGAKGLRESELSHGEHQYISDPQRHYLERLGETSGPQVAGAVQRLLDHWRSRGGELEYTRGGASCAPILRRGREVLAALRFYAEKVEIPFGTLKRRAPLDDAARRKAFRDRLNAAPGVDIPVTKLQNYPSFRVTLLADEAVWDVVLGALDWFQDIVQQEP